MGPRAWRRRWGAATAAGVLVATVPAGCLALLAACAGEPPIGAETVVVVHGLGRTPRSMVVLETRLRAAGYRTVSVGYDSRSGTLEALTEVLAEEVRACCSPDTASVHFVTHSMGGVLVRRYLHARPGHSGRVVMLSPPAGGSELVDVLSSVEAGSAALGPAGAELGTGDGGVAADLGPVDFELGIVTGDRSANPITSAIIPGPDDGKVAVERARFPGASDFLVVGATHTFIMNRRDVAEAVTAFLRDGRFEATGPDLDSL